MIFSICPDKIIFLGTPSHVSHAENRSNKTYGKNNTQNRYPLIFSVYFSIPGDEA